ncbi:AraC family transcriptional regulator [Phyllobacterium phragmitis]|uniref:AraC family transcriptional regulator n=1 Tax=Phyllobacterium phragmitis TaxID=2670329 RepID=A0A2S9ITE4_9HYPH|nr:AraC family transcriptional regulator [Phyllobacterium phragmitis]PRD43797.1 AraC family transcriptional regulator [Phyllobacterium phragmitis]
MTFHPQMKSKVEGVSVIGGLRWRAWNGVIADVWSVVCADGASGEYVSRAPRLFVVLDNDGAGRFAIRQSEHQQAVATKAGPYRMSYIPAGMPIWSQVESTGFLRHLDLHFDIETLSRRFAGELDMRKLSVPRLMFSDERIAALANLIAAECLNDDPLHDLYGDGLVAALFADLFKIGQKPERKRSQLSPRQLRRAIDFIEENCLRSIRLRELADRAGLSETYFSHAFKASTGIPPHQWQMQARIRKAQEFMNRKTVSLTSVASAAGFSDQAHFTRVFKRFVGVTPAAWLRGQSH